MNSLKFKYFKYYEEWIDIIKELKKEDYLIFIDVINNQNRKLQLNLYYGRFIKILKHPHKYIIEINPISINSIKVITSKNLNLKGSKNSNFNFNLSITTHVTTICPIEFSHLQSYLTYWENIIFSNEICKFDGIIRKKLPVAYNSWFYSNEVGKINLKYMFYGYLDTRDKIDKGFFDPGRYICRRKDYSTDLSDYYLKYRNKNIHQINIKLHKGAQREIIIVDPDLDPQLRHHYRFVKQNTKYLKSQYKIVKFISKYVANVMTRKTDKVLVKKHINNLMAFNHGNIVYLGQIKYGVCRHKSILFKYLCDRIGIKCILIRGFINKKKNNRKKPTFEDDDDEFDDELDKIELEDNEFDDDEFDDDELDDDELDDDELDDNDESKEDKNSFKSNFYNFFSKLFHIGEYNKNKKHRRNHVWNLVVIKKKIYICDVRNRPGKLIKINDAHNDKFIKNFIRSKGKSGQLGATLIEP